MLEAVQCKKEFLESVYSATFTSDYASLGEPSVPKMLGFFKQRFDIELPQKAQLKALPALASSLLGVLDSVLLDSASKLISTERADELENADFRTGRTRFYGLINQVDLKLGSADNQSLEDIMRTSELRNQLVQASLEGVGRALTAAGESERKGTVFLAGVAENVLPSGQLGQGRGPAGAGAAPAL